MATKRALEMQQDDDGDSDVEYHVRTLGASEDLVIDGETAIDDLLVAQRIAQQEEFITEASAHEGGGSGGGGTSSSHAAAQKAKEPAPQSADLAELQRLLQMTNELAAKMGGGKEVREACAAAAAAVERVPVTAEAEAGHVEDTEGDKAAAARMMADALAGVDLASTSESEAEVDPSQPVKDDAGAADDMDVVPEDVARASLKELLEKEEDENDEEKEERGDNGIMKEEQRIVEVDEGAPQIRTVQLPETLPPDSATERIGEVLSVVDGLLVVRGDENGKALDLQSVLCTEDLRVLGVVADVFGPVVQPHYLVYQGSSKVELEELKPGTPVVAATGLEETSYLCDSADPAAVNAALTARYGELADCESEASEEDFVDEDSEAENADEPPALADGSGRGKGAGGKAGAAKGQKGGKAKGKGKSKKGGGEDGGKGAAWRGAPPGPADGRQEPSLGPPHLGAASSSLPLPPPPPPPGPPAWQGEEPADGAFQRPVPQGTSPLHRGRGPSPGRKGFGKGARGSGPPPSRSAPY